jgi:hypothetical protein
MEEIEEKIIVLRKELIKSKTTLERLYKNYLTKKSEADLVYQLYLSEGKLYKEIDEKLAELDGRLKVIKVGESGKEKKMTVPNLTQSQAKNLLGKLKSMMKK